MATGKLVQAARDAGISQEEVIGYYKTFIEEKMDEDSQSDLVLESIRDLRDMVGLNPQMDASGGEDSFAELASEMEEAEAEVVEPKESKALPE